MCNDIIPSYVLSLKTRTGSAWRAILTRWALRWREGEHLLGTGHDTHEKAPQDARRASRGASVLEAGSVPLPVRRGRSDRFSGRPSFP